MSLLDALAAWLAATVIFGVADLLATVYRTTSTDPPDH